MGTWLASSSMNSVTHTSSVLKSVDVLHPSSPDEAPEKLAARQIQ